MSLENFSHVQIHWQLHMSRCLCTAAGKSKRKRRRRRRRGRKLTTGDSQQSADICVSTAERQQMVQSKL